MINLIEKEKKYFLPTYNRIPVDISHGKGVYLFDKDGKKYLDFFSGLAVNALGYSDPDIVKAVNEQISRFAHLSNSFITDIQIEFAEKLLKYSGMSGVFFTNSGTEAIEGAIKLVRKINGPDKNIFSFTGAFHGRTYGALSLTPKEKYQKSFKPLLPNVSYIEFNNIEDLTKKVNENTAVVFIELIQGEGGIVPASDEFVNSLNELRNKYSFLLAVDEIQTGTGRTGKPFAYNHYNIIPDIVITAKAIGGGLPLGAMLVSEEFKNTFSIGEHGTTFGGNPVACAAGNVVLKKVFDEGLLNKVKVNGEYFLKLLIDVKNDFQEDIKEVRGKGYMLGVEHKDECSKIVDEFRKKGILVNCTNQNVVRILPPLIAEKEHFDIFISEYRDILRSSTIS